MEDITRQFNDNKDEHKTFMMKLDDLTKGQSEIQISLAALPEALADKFDERYASKDTEKALNKLNWLVISSVVIAILALVIKGI